MNKEIEMPNHVGVIMDGNGRWAKKKGLPRSKGHIEGSKALEKLINNVFKKGIKVLSVFAFSTDNFKRSKEEVDNLMSLFIEVLKVSSIKYRKKNIKVIFSGRRDNLSKKVNNVMNQVEKDTRNNDGYIFNICWNYSGQFEILDMVKKVSEKVINKEIDISDIDLEVLNKNLYNELPPVDLLIRTSGELRTSGFMLYQLAYSEYYFTDVHFPDFNEKELDKALKSFTARNRRFGQINEES